jgi:DNA-binding NarL/FixJ family response regulator
MRVLIADDSDLILERLDQVLKQFEEVTIVGVCKSGTDALDTLLFLKPDLAILDIKMPGLNGLEILKEIRKEKLNMKVIILTFHATDFHRQAAILAGADYFLSKVDDFEMLSQVVNEILLIDK